MSENRFIDNGDGRIIAICGDATGEVRGAKGKSGNVTKWVQMGRNGLKICQYGAILHNKPI